jgi:hypothetical protein
MTPQVDIPVEFQIPPEYSISALLAAPQNGGPKRKSKLKILLSDWYGRGILIFILGLMLTLVLIGVTYLQSEQEWNPLGAYPPQVVLNARTEPINGISALPVVYLNESVYIRALKCNTSNATVKVEGEKNWISVLPLGESSVPTFGIGARLPGCTQLQFSNSIPPEVQKIVTQYGKPMIWHVTGYETPLRCDAKDCHKAGQTRYWETGNFVIVPKNAANPCGLTCQK